MYFWVSNQHIRMISEGSCDTAAITTENSALNSSNNVNITKTFKN